LDGGSDPQAERTRSPDPLAALLGDALRDQRLRQERLRDAQEFLSSPRFVELRDQPIEVSDDLDALQARASDLDFRMKVLDSILALMREEQEILLRVIESKVSGPASGDQS
jgi:hypothetical protein